uniref:CHK domain-containing protein n=1 Tax=Ascaris lumbricoides TaxID=6252 RepID=A0A0M3HTU6_ASCLU
MKGLCSLSVHGTTIYLEMGCGTSKVKMGDTREGMPHKNEQSSTQKAAEMADDSSTNVPDEEVPNSSLNSQYNQYLCGTDITLQWLHKKLMEALCADEPIPHWIAERIDTLPYNKFQRSKVIKVTFGWENPKMPSSVILKVPQRIQDDEGGPPDDAQNRLISSIECTVYEWFAKQKKLAVPRTLHIKKHSTESSCGVIVMEDLGEKGQRGSLRDGLAVDGAKDLLRNLAMIHAKSLLSGDWTTMVPEISPLHYRGLAEKSEEACATFLKNLSDEQKEVGFGFNIHNYIRQNK